MTESHAVDCEPIELMAMNRKMPQARIVPHVLLINLYANEVGHYIRESEVMIPLYPNYFNFTLRVGQFADIAKKLPMLFCETPEVEVGKDIAQKN